MKRFNYVTFSLSLHKKDKLKYKKYDYKSQN